MQTFIPNTQPYHPVSCHTHICNNFVPCVPRDYRTGVYCQSPPSDLMLATHLSTFPDCHNMAFGLGSLSENMINPSAPLVEDISEVSLREEITISPKVAAIGMFVHNKALLYHGKSKITRDMVAFLDLLSRKSRPHEKNQQVTTVYLQIMQAWWKYENEYAINSFKDFFLLTLLGELMIECDKCIWGLSKSPKDIWCEFAASCCMVSNVLTPN